MNLQIVNAEDLETAKPGLYLFNVACAVGEELRYDVLTGMHMVGRTTGRVFARVRTTGELPNGADEAYNRKSDGLAVALWNEVVFDKDESVTITQGGDDACKEGS